jgi:hypothetical protein
MPDDLSSIRARLDGLDDRLARLEKTVDRLVGSAAPRPERPAPPRTTERPPPSPYRRRRSTGVAIRRALQGKDSAYWLSRAGIALLLLGLAFLFRYAVDQGWLTAHLRVGFGLALGVVLVVVGLRVPSERSWFRGIALGGAAATFYITGFAAYQIFQLVGYGPAMAFMVTVTVFTLAAGWVVDQPVLGVLGAAGGLGTPFLLFTGEGSIAGLAVYETAVLMGAAGIYLRRGWSSLLWTTVVGGWWVLAIGLFTLLRQDDPRAVDRWALQLAVFTAVAAFWAVPVLRELLAVRAPDRWPKPSLARLGREAGALVEALRERGLRILVVATPFIAFYLTRAIWTPADAVAAALAFAGAAVWGAVWWSLRGREVSQGLASFHLVAAAVLSAIALQQLFSAETLLVTWMVEATALLWVARGTGDRLGRLSGHALAALVGSWLALRLLSGVIDFPIAHQALADAVVIGLAMVAALAVAGRERLWYRLAILAAVALWLLRELPALPGGEAAVLPGWGLLAALALWLGRRWRAEEVTVFAHALFGLTAVMLADQLMSGGESGAAVLNVPAALRLLTLGVGLVAGRALTASGAGQAYLAAAHVLFLGWLWDELSRLPAGHAWVTVSWGAYGAALLLAGLRRDHAWLRRVALATLAAVVAKLFLVDLARLEPIWRTLLFLGFGGSFLALSYYFPSLWKAEAEAAPGTEKPAD